MSHLNTKISIAIVLTALISACGITKTEIYILPKDFRGINDSIYIIYNNKQGTPIVRSNGVFIHAVPADGLLIYRDKEEFGTFKSTIYMESENGLHEISSFGGGNFEIKDSDGSVLMQGEHIYMNGKNKSDLSNENLLKLVENKLASIQR